MEKDAIIGQLFRKIGLRKVKRDAREAIGNPYVDKEGNIFIPGQMLSKRELRKLVKQYGLKKRRRRLKLAMELIKKEK